MYKFLISISLLMIINAHATSVMPSPWGDGSPLPMDSNIDPRFKMDMEQYIKQMQSPLVTPEIEQLSLDKLLERNIENQNPDDLKICFTKTTCTGEGADKTCTSYEICAGS